MKKNLITASIILLSVFQPGIETIKLLNGTEAHYVQRIYVDPMEKNKLKILIKPNYWNSLTPKDKEDILHRVSAKWSEIYKNTSDTKLVPEVGFSNI